MAGTPESRRSNPHYLTFCAEWLGPCLGPVASYRNQAPIGTEQFPRDSSGGFASLTELGTITSIVLLSIASASLLAFLPSFWAMPSAFLSDSAGAVATGTINCVAAGLGGFFGPALIGYQATRTHSFRYGFGCLAVALVIAGVLPLLLRVRRHISAPVIHENHK